MRLDRASVVLTGASGTVGAAIARRLVYEGARVLLTGRSSQDLLKLAAEIGGGAPNRTRVDALVADLNSPAGRAAIQDAAEARNVNVLINNAGTPAFGLCGVLAEATVSEAVQTNLLSPILLTAGLLPHLARQPHAQILNIGCTLGSIGMPGFAAYGATKAGLRGFSEALRRELAGTAVKVQYLAPRTVAIDAPRRAAHADSPDAVARAVISMIHSERAERYLGTGAGMAARLNSLFPRLLDSTFGKRRRTPRGGARSLHESR